MLDVSTFINDRSENIFFKLLGGQFFIDETGVIKRHGTLVNKNDVELRQTCRVYTLEKCMVANDTLRVWWGTRDVHGRKD